MEWRVSGVLPAPRQPYQSGVERSSKAKVSFLAPISSDQNGNLINGRHKHFIRNRGARVIRVVNTFGQLHRRVVDFSVRHLAE